MTVIRIILRLFFTKRHLVAANFHLWKRSTGQTRKVWKEQTHRCDI